MLKLASLALFGQVAMGAISFNGLPSCKSKTMQSVGSFDGDYTITLTYA